ncbi:MAG: glycosyltransferase [Kiritimatiellia bacterium]|jgi:glycosyltransferase involved in cell wall biosynthesis
MKILIISKLMPSTTGVSGAAIVYNRIRHIVSLGWDVDVLTFIPSGDGVQEEAARLREYVRRLEMLPLPTEGSLGYRQLYSFPRVPYPFCTVSSLAMALLTGEMVRRERYNVALAEFSEMGQYLFANPYLGAVRRIVSCHECRTAAWERAIRLHLWRYGGITKRLHFKRLRRYEFAMYNNMDHVLALTSQERHALLKYAPNLRVAVAPPGIKPPPAQERPLPPGRCLLFIGCYANEANRDAVRWFARAVWPLLKARYPDLLFYVIGYGATRDIWELGRRDSSIIVTGAVDDWQPYLAKARVFVCPFRMGGGFHVKILEAMAAGVPVVSTSIGAAGIPSWDGESILLADTARQFFRCVSLLLDDPGVCRTLAANAREMVEHRFTGANEKAVLAQVLEEVATGYD